MYKLGKMIFIVFLISLTIVGCSNGVEDVSDNTYTLKIQKGGEGEGNIIKPDGKGEYQYKEDTVVTLKIEPAINNKFTGWEGTNSNDVVDGDGENEWKITINENKNIKAIFEKKEYPLNVELQGEGTVNEEVVTSAQDYNHGTVVELTANSDEGWYFDHWEGDLTGSESPKQVTVDSEVNVTAVFEKKEYPLNIELKGEGTVNEKVVTSTQDYNHGTVVELTANSDEGWYFDHWEGDLTGSESPKQVTVDSEVNITANFKETSILSGNISLYNSTGYTFSSSSSSTNSNIGSQEEIETRKNDSKFKENEIIVKYKPLVSTQSVKSLETNNSLTKISQMTKRGNIALYKIPKDKTVPQMIDKFKNKKNIEWVEPNYLYKAMEVPNDPDYDKQWGNRVVNLEAAWDIEKGSNSVKVAVVDTGIIPNHPDLENNLLKGADFVGGSDGTDIDDPSNYEPTDYDPTDETPNDPNDPNLNGSHGTHVAGIIGAVANNSNGIAGANWDIDILPVRVLDADGYGSIWDIAEGIYYSIDQGANIINLSLGGSNTSNFYKESVDYAYNNGVIVFAASGNAGSDEIAYPAKYNSTVAVGSVNRNYERSSFSNYGPELDLVASGGSHPNSTIDKGIYSTWGYYNSGNPISSYSYKSGTSMATPYASGVAALLISNGVTGVENIKERMTSSAVDLGTEGKDDYYGYGLVDAYGALLDKRLKNPYVFAGKESDGQIEVVSEIVRVNDNGSYKLTEVEEGNLKIYSWRDVNENEEIDSGDYWGVSDNSINVTENSFYNNINIEVYYATEEEASSLEIKNFK